jgi:carboxypeptidase T
MIRRVAASSSAFGWLVLAGLCAAVVALGVVGRPPAARRVAIRVTCEARSCELAETAALDVWSDVRGPGIPLDVVVSSDSLETLAEAGVTWEVLVPDIDAVAAAEAARLRSPAAQRGGDWFGEYKDLAAIGARLEGMAAIAPERAKVVAIGGSVEGRPIWALRIGHGPKKMMIDGTLHAREWIASMVTTCVADRLVRDYDKDPAIKAFVDKTELWVVPVANPDGYQYAWGSDRYWRKNRRDRKGVDLNRNFGVAFGGPGSSGRQGAETYRGAYAFSEPESAALRDLAMRERFALHVDFHSYSQLILFPWTHTSTAAPDKAWFAAMGDKMASAMFAAHRVRYELMAGAGLYPASGSMTDWMYGEGGAKSFTIELRPGRNRGRTGFVLPPEEIRPSCDEGLAAVMALGNGL